MNEAKWWEQTYKEAPEEEIPWERGDPRPELVELINNMKFTPGTKMLDLGCGLGTQTIYTASKGFDAYGIDFSPTAIAKAKKKAKEAGAKVNFTVGNVLSLPYQDNIFSFAFDFGCLHHNTAKAEGYLDELKRVLKKRGLYLLFTFPERLSQEKIHSLFEKDFEILELASTTHSEGASGAVHKLWRVLMKKRS